MNNQIVRPKLHRRFSYHNARVTQLCFKTNQSVFSSSLDGRCILWNLEDKRHNVCFEPHNGPILGVCYNARNNLTATCSMDNSVKLWRPTKDKFVTCSLLHSDIVRGLDINQEDSRLATISDDNAIKIWDIETRKYLHMMAACEDCWFRCVKFSPCGQLIATAGQDRKIRIFDIRTRYAIHTFDDFSGVPRKINWHPAGYMIGAAYNNNRILIYNICDEEVHQTYDVHAAPINDIAFHPDGCFLASASEDQTIKIIDLMLGVPSYTLFCHQCPVRSVSFSSNKLASADDEGDVMLWDIELNTYNVDGYMEKPTDSETMAAAGEIHSDTSIVVDQRNADVYRHHNTKVVHSFNATENKEIPQEYLPPSRIPVRPGTHAIRYELDDY